MLEICKLSREVALSVFEPRINLFCTSRDKPTPVLCAIPKNSLESAKRIHIYTKKQHRDIEFRAGSEICSVINWMHCSEGFRIIERSEVRIKVMYPATWPLEEGDRLDNALLFEGRLPLHKDIRRFLPQRLHSLSFLTLRNTSRGRRR